jgi:hypothetical protein
MPVFIMMLKVGEASRQGNTHSKGFFSKSEADKNTLAWQQFCVVLAITHDADK